MPFPCKSTSFPRISSAAVVGRLRLILQTLPGRKYFKTCALAWCCFLAWSLPAAAEMQIFELQHRSAVELAEIVRSIVSEKAKVAAHQNTLVVRTDPAELAEVARLVADFDRAQSMLRITVDQGARTDSQGQDVGAAVRVRNDSVKIGIGSPRKPGDDSVFVSTGEVRGGIHGQNAQVMESRQISQSISVLEGSPASIRVGRAIPFTSELRYYWNRHPHYVAATEYVNVDTGFEVIPYIQGEMVQLEIQPFMTFLDNDDLQQIVFHELSTTVRLPFGAWYDLGGQNSSLSSLGREILRTGSRADIAGNTIRVRVDPGPWETDRP